MLFPVGVLCDYLRVFFLVVIQDGFSAVIFLSMTSLAVNIQTITVCCPISKEHSCPVLGLSS